MGWGSTAKGSDIGQFCAPPRLLSWGCSIGCGRRGCPIPPLFQRLTLEGNEMMLLVILGPLLSTWSGNRRHLWKTEGSSGWRNQLTWTQSKRTNHLHRTIETLRLGKTLKIIYSNHQPTTNQAILPRCHIYPTFSPLHQHL